MKYKERNDYELLYMVRENDENCYNALFNKYLPILKKISYEYYLKYSKFGYDYDDFLQEAIYAYHLALSNYKDNQNTLFYTFVCVCVKRKLISFCRKFSLKENDVDYLDVYDEKSFSIEDPNSNVEMIVQEEEMLNLYRKVIVNLPIDLSSILELRINGFTYEEIGELLDIPRTTVEYKSRKIKKRLRHILNSYDKKTV